jgi:hypothetical protein
LQSLISPLATLFWTVFKFDVDKNYFHWDPEFNSTTGFTIGGLALIVPGVLLYNFFSNREAKQAALHRQREEIR